MKPTELQAVADWIAQQGPLASITVKTVSGVTAGLSLPGNSKPEPVKYKRVRIAVAIGQTGEWCSYGWSNSDQKSLRNMVVDNFYDDLKDGPPQVHFIEADVPIPAPQTIQGEVQP
jgi:hypothetical protein